MMVRYWKKPKANQPDLGVYKRRSHLHTGTESASSLFRVCSRPTHLGFYDCGEGESSEGGEAVDHDGRRDRMEDHAKTFGSDVGG